jgi:hypothetical protein
MGPRREEEETGRGVLRCRERCGARSRPSTPHLALVEGHEAAASLGLYNYLFINKQFFAMQKN